MAQLSRTKTGKVSARKADQAKERKSAKASPNGNRRLIEGRETEVARLRRALKEAHEQQTSTAEVLQVINSSHGDLAPVFDAILEKAHNLCGVTQGSLQLYDGAKFRAVAVHGLSEAFADRLRQGFSVSPKYPANRLLEGARFVQIPDQGAADHPIARAAFELGGIRTALFIPANSLAGSPPLAKRSSPSPRKRSGFSRASPRRPSSPSRMRGCSMSCASAPLI